MQILQQSPMDILRSKCASYKASSSADVLKQLEAYSRNSTTALAPDDDFSGLQRFLEELCLNAPDAISRFTSYDIVVVLCRVFPIELVLPATCLETIIKEINYVTPLETAAAVQTISDLVRIPKFNDVLRSCQGVTVSLDREFQFLKEVNFDPAQADAVYIVSILQLVTILAPQMILGIDNFDNFTNALTKVYLESIAFILQTANFQQKSVLLNKPAVTNFIDQNLHSTSQENHLIAAISAAASLALPEFEALKPRYYDLCSSPIQSVRQVALEGLANITQNSCDGVKTVMRIPGFLDWLLNRGTESEKRCLELKATVVANIELQTRSKTVDLDPRLVLSLKGFLKDGAFYDGSRPEPMAATENL